MPEVRTNLLAGHAPAMFVGGKRVSQSRHHHEKETRDRKDSSMDSNDESSAPTPNVNSINGLNSSPIKIEDAYPTEAVKRFHEKPHPTHEKPVHIKQHLNIVQPRK